MYHKSFLFCWIITMVTGKIMNRYLSRLMWKGRSFRTSVGSYRSVIFSVLHSYLKQKLVYGYINFDIIDVPEIIFPLTVHNIGYWYVIEEIFSLFDPGTKKLSKKRGIKRIQYFCNHLELFKIEVCVVVHWFRMNPCTPHHFLSDGL